MNDEYFLSQRAICLGLSPDLALCSLALPLEPSRHSMDSTLTGLELSKAAHERFPCQDQLLRGSPPAVPDSLAPSRALMTNEELNISAPQYVTHESLHRKRDLLEKPHQLFWLRWVLHEDLYKCSKFVKLKREQTHKCLNQQVTNENIMVEINRRARKGVSVKAINPKKKYSRISKQYVVGQIVGFTAQELVLVKTLCARGLIKPQNLPLQLLQALPTLAIQGTRRRQPERRHQGVLLSLPPHSLSQAQPLLGRVHQLPEDEHGTCQGDLPIIQGASDHRSSTAASSHAASSFILRCLPGCEGILTTPTASECSRTGRATGRACLQLSVLKRLTDVRRISCLWTSTSSVPNHDLLGWCS
ncbi:hypothetical protein EK904_005317 [Melospiza melodia maxima]|nr:hypothetical protein EK904_005317 [Melospiza melodia maxima]